MMNRCSERTTINLQANMAYWALAKDLTTNLTTTEDEREKQRSVKEAKRLEKALVRYAIEKHAYESDLRKQWMRNLEALHSQRFSIWYPKVWRLWLENELYVQLDTVDEHVRAQTKIQLDLVLRDPTFDNIREFVAGLQFRPFPKPSPTDLRARL